MSKSPKRRRSVLRQTWLTPEEDALIEKQRIAAGVSRSEYIRIALFRYRPPATKIQTHALSHLSGEIGKIGSNINQIAYHLNAGRPGDRIEGLLEDSLRALHEWQGALMQALGHQRNRKPEKVDIDRKDHQ
jgi:hypothetical protein